jgi:hypothetical protein
MPDSLSQNELRRVRQLPPGSPYQTYSYDYSYYMGDVKSAQRRRHQMERQTYIPSTEPTDRSRVYENVSKAQPYVYYNDVELKPGPETSDGFPHQSYYYLMDYDDKGLIAVKPGMTLVPGMRVRMDGRTYRVKGRRPVTAQLPQQPMVPKSKVKPGSTYISLESFGG